MLSTKKEFRIRTRRFFLTYPQLPGDIENLEELAVTNFERIFRMDRSDFKYTICKELHEDGNPHLHVYLEFNAVQKIYSPTKLDLVIEGKEEPYHGNYQAVKSQHGTLQYIIKAAPSIDSVTKNWEMPLYRGVYYTSCEEHLHAVLKNEGLSKARSVLYESYPKEAIRRGSTLLGNLINMSAHLRELKTKAQIKVFGLHEFANVSDAIWAWVENPRSGSLVLYGPSGTGKTELAKSLLKSMGLDYIVIGDKNSLKNLDLSLHQAILFDDMNFEPIAREEFIALLDTANGGDVRILYNVVTIPGDIARVFTTNRPHELFQSDTAIERRAIGVEILEPVWKLPSGDSPKGLKDPSYRSYKFGVGIPLHPALEHITGISSTEALAPSMNVEINQVVDFKWLTSTTLEPEKILLIEAGEKRKRRGRLKRIFKVKTSLINSHNKKEKK